MSHDVCLRKPVFDRSDEEMGEQYAEFGINMAYWNDRVDLIEMSGMPSLLVSLTRDEALRLVEFINQSFPLDALGQIADG